MDGINSFKPIDPALIEPQLKSGANRQVNASDTTTDKTGQTAKLDKAASEFEALFIYHMLKTMRESSMKEDLLSGGKGEEVYTSMLDQEMSSVMSQGEGIGLKKALMEQLLSNLEIEGGEEKADNIGALSPKVDKIAAIKEFQSHLINDEFVSPAPGNVISGYGIRKDPATGEHAFHSGIDISAPEGTPVRPSKQGLVVFSGVKTGYGNTVELRHDNDYVSRYSNNRVNLVKVGERVEAPDVIALVGGKGDTTESHLHFEIMVEGFSVNPVDVLDFN